MHANVIRAVARNMMKRNGSFGLLPLSLFSHIFLVDMGHTGRQSVRADAEKMPDLLNLFQRPVALLPEI